MCHSGVDLGRSSTSCSISLCCTEEAGLIAGDVSCSHDLSGRETTLSSLQSDVCHGANRALRGSRRCNGSQSCASVPAPRCQSRAGTTHTASPSTRTSRTVGPPPKLRPLPHLQQRDQPLRSDGLRARWVAGKAKRSSLRSMASQTPERQPTAMAAPPGPHPLLQLSRAQIDLSNRQARRLAGGQRT